MANAWIEHVKKWAKENSKTYGCAISDERCKASYKSGSVAKVKSKLVENIKSKTVFPPEFEIFRFTMPQELDILASELTQLERYEKSPFVPKPGSKTDDAIQLLRTIQNKNQAKGNSPKSAREFVLLARRYSNFYNDRTNKGFKLKEKYDTSKFRFRD